MMQKQTYEEIVAVVNLYGTGEEPQEAEDRVDEISAVRESRQRYEELPRQHRAEDTCRNTFLPGVRHLHK